MSFFPLSVLSVLVTLCSATRRENTTLWLVQTLSRHGDRAPTVLYPNDPNRPNATNCFPNGLGELTQLGYQQEFDVGVFLRSLYGDFVPTDPKEIYVNSSGYNRCVDSAAALLASFYPTEEKQPPIPIHKLPPGMDKYLDYSFQCHQANEEYFKAEEIAKNQQNQQQKATVQELSKLSGVDFSNLGLASYVSIAVEEEMIHNCTVPEWAYKYYDVIKQNYNEYLHLHLIPREQTRLRFGPLLGLFVNNLKNKLDGKTDLKFVFNMAHDLQMGGMLTALNFTDLPHPPFCSTLLFELHQMADSSMAVRLRYMNTTTPLDHKEEQPVLLVLDGCTEFCPVDYFMKIFQGLIPDDWEKECLNDT